MIIKNKMKKTFNSNSNSKLRDWILCFSNRGALWWVCCVIYLCAVGSWRSVAETFRSSNDRSNINDSVNLSAHKELLKNPLFFGECTQLIGAPQKYICANACPLSERNTFHRSFPSCLRQCTHHWVTWCNVRAMGRLALGGGWVSLWRSAVCMCATEPWLPHYLIIKRLLFYSAFYRTAEIFPILWINQFFLKDRSALIFI